MIERPILFSGPLVRAILDGRKTQTRRLVKPQLPAGKSVWPCSWTGTGWSMGQDPAFHQPAGCNCTRLRPPAYEGDRLYVRETWSHTGDGVWSPRDALCAMNGKFIYRATDDVPGAGWFPSIHMPKRAARLFLTVESVRVERLQSITEEDAIAEGAMSYPTEHGSRWTLFPEHVGKFEHGLVSARFAFGNAWNRVYGGDKWNCNGKPEPWGLNPWVWVVTFKRADDAAGGAK